MKKEEVEIFYPASQQEWRQWLQGNHRSKQSVWLVYYKKKAGMPTITWSEAVDEALCFGWIDSQAKPVDEEKYMQFFCRRKPNGTWSKVNKEKIKQLVEAGLITQAGLETIAAAQQNGSWTILDEVEELIIPEDLAKAFDTRPGAQDYFLSLSKSVRKAILQWLVLARQASTREKRISEIAESAGQKLKPKQFR